MCGPTSALGLAEHERVLWPFLRERLRRPGRLMGLMRAVLGDDVEVAVVVETTPSGVARPLALLATPAIAAEVELLEHGGAGDLRPGRVGGDDVEVVLGSVHGEPVRPVAVLVNDWLRVNLHPYARELWHRPRREP